METPREHIEKIREELISMGSRGAKNLHQAVKYLSAELYAKDVHFLMELIQNAEDNGYAEGVDPSLEFVITSRDITATGAPATLLVFNNEKGFAPKDIDSVCSVGLSTKKGNRKHGYIGEKGIGFKSVFLITSQPYIFSNGYQIRFSEKPCPHCDLGYIVPEWVDANPSISDITKIYGTCGSVLPTTTLILPLKPDKVQPVKKQLSSLDPEILLFLSKIKRLSVREDNEDPRRNTVTAIEIASETNLVTRKNIDAQSYTLYLSAEKEECGYYMWKQKFPVNEECKVERRMEVNEWIITLAFPSGERLRRGMNTSPGVYAFLPTQMVTNFPFIIQADFLLASSRETILLDNKWNQGILDCVPTAFVNAFVSLVRSIEGAPVASLPHMFKFLPVETSSYEELNAVREKIREKISEESIVPSESQKQQMFFYKPREVGRLMPSFWDILRKARDKGVSLINLSSHGRYVLSYSFDKVEFDHILSFLGVEPVDNDWYAKCIQGTSNLVTGVSEDVYLELLLFISDNWGSKFCHTHIKNIPLIKIVGYGSKSLCSISATQEGDCRIRLSSKSGHVSWLINWNGEFLSSNNSLIFMPERTQDAMELCSRKETLKKWLGEQVKVRSVSVYEYADDLLENLPNAKKLVIALAHFLYQSWCKGYISDWEAGKLCQTLPLVDKYGRVIRDRTGVLVPANGSKWACLTDSNLWRNYVELGEDYLNSGYYAGTSTPQKKLLGFLKDHAEASDVPNISAPSDSIPSLSAPLTKPNAFLLLDWICYLLRERIPIPQKFLRSIKEGSWLKVTLNGSPGFRPPSQSFLLSSRGNILQNSSVLVEIPLVDQSHYGEGINRYKEELKTIGVRFEFGEACEYMGKHLMSLAASSSLTSDNVLSVLRFIKLLREELLSPVDFICSIKEGRWLKTSLGYKSPVGSVLSDEEWTVALKVSNIPIIDDGFYGKDIYEFKTELELLGVVISFSKSYQLVIDNLKSPSCLSSWTPDVLLLLLKCMSLSGSSEKLVRTLKEAKCLKTKDGDKYPEGCLLFDSEWGCILRVFSGLPLIADDFYGDKISSYKNELKKLGVVVDFEKAVEAFACYFTGQAASASITNENVASFLLCYRKLQGKFPAKPKSCICEVRWLRTRLGDCRSPKECILFSPDWDFISPICRLPFIDDSDKCYGKNIHKHKEELKSLGVVVEFKDGVKFVESGGLHLPQNPGCISRENALALLECIRILLQEKYYSLSEDFMGKVSQPWLKTHAGYRPPSQCLLFDSEFGKFLKQTDGPFLDEEFYGNKITTYKKELSAIGVIVDAKQKQGCSLIAGHLDLHEEFSTFVRVYNYLSECEWEPERYSEAVRKVWIPKGNQKGEWVSADECVLHDKDGLFGLQLTVLEKHYERKLLSFFSCAFGVKSNPSLDDYLKLWKIWESSESGLSHDQCCKFWGFVSKHWQTLEKENTLADAIMKVPVNSGSGGILLCKKQDVFIGDDLQLQLLFQQSCHNVFVWYPQPSLASLPRSKLLQMYRKIGIRTISESVQKEESLANDAELKLVPTEKLFGKALLRMILSFLAGPPMEMDAEKRQKAIQGLVSVSVVESTEPIAVSYNLPLSSGEILNVKGSRKMRWDREESKFFTQKMEESGGQKSVIEFATYFSEAISECVLWDNIDHIGALCELIKLAFVLKLNGEAVEFLLQSKNLQVFEEDEEFLKSAYP